MVLKQEEQLKFQEKHGKKIFMKYYSYMKLNKEKNLINKNYEIR